jgi:hypothetical protein
MNVVALTVSTNYSDLVPIVIESNEKYFKHWYWVTSIDDTATINAIPKTSKHTVLYWDFKNNGKLFDKGGGMKQIQTQAYQHYPDDWYLIIDSDIALQPNFTINTAELDPNKLYGLEERQCFYSKKTFDANQPDFIMRDMWPWGFFQLYKKHYFYESSYYAGGPDDNFLHHFGGNTRELQKNHVQVLPTYCRHLGKVYQDQNWRGFRVPGSDFTI